MTPIHDAALVNLQKARNWTKDLNAALEGPFTCATCRHEHLTGTTRQYSADCPNAQRGYDPLDNLKSGLPESEIFCAAWQCDRHWYYAATTAQQDRDMVPGHLKP